MIIITLRMIIQRFSELVVTTSAISAMLTILNVTGVLNTQDALSIGMFAGVAFFAVMNTLMLRHSLFELKNIYIYYISNILAHIAFIIFGYIVYTNYPIEIYTWFLAVAKFARYSNIEISNFYSAAVFYIIGFILIFTAPIGMWRRMLYDDTDEEYTGEEIDS